MIYQERFLNKTMKELFLFPIDIIKTNQKFYLLKPISLKILTIGR